MNNGKCPQCGGSLYCDEVDIGVGTQQCGPWTCEECGWFDGYESEMEADYPGPDVLQEVKDDAS